MNLELALIIASTVPATLFPVLYTVWTNWWRTAEGRHLFFFTLGMTGLYGLTLLGHFFGQFPWFEALSMATLLLLCYQLWRRLWLLAQYNGRRARRGRADHPRRRATDAPGRPAPKDPA